MSRSVPEWIADHDDQAIPPRVKLRVFERDGKRCQHCTLTIVGKLLPAYDHKVALVNGGEHRESNLQLLCTICHAVKTRGDVGLKSQRARRAKKKLRLVPRRTVPGRKFDGTPIPARFK